MGCRQEVSQVEHVSGAELDDPLGSASSQRMRSGVVEAAMMRFRRQAADGCGYCAVHELPERVAGAVLVNNVQQTPAGSALLDVLLRCTEDAGHRRAVRVTRESGAGHARVDPGLHADGSTDTVDVAVTGDFHD